MPSWNIHIAHAERLFSRGGAIARTVVDRNAFLFGSLVPDIPVGYMVPGIEHPIAYRTTHFAEPAFIPKPREREFWDAYVVPAAKSAGAVCSGGDCPGDDCPSGNYSEGVRAGVASSLVEAGCRGIIGASSLAADADRVSRVHYPHRYEGADDPLQEGSALDEAVAPEDIARSLLDLELGIWAHLLADCIWNTRVNEYLEREGIAPSEEFRVKKQGDFDTFGKTLAIDLVPRVTPRLVATAAAYPQYSIDERAVLMTTGVAHEIVRENTFPSEPAQYRLLTGEFFEAVCAEVAERADALLKERIGMLLP